MARVAVVLSGCGHLDGAEIRESVLTLLELDKAGADVSLFAPDIDQHHVVDHLTGEETTETRNVLHEAARIARGQIMPLSQASAVDFDALILPGGYGVAKNLSDLAFKGAEATVLPEFKALILDFLHQQKPIGAICIAPAVLVSAVGGEVSPNVTIGEDADGLIEALGGRHQPCSTPDHVTDTANRIYSCSAYMREDRISQVAEGIAKVVHAVLDQVALSQQAA